MAKYGAGPFADWPHRVVYAWRARQESSGTGT